MRGVRVGLALGMVLVTSGCLGQRYERIMQIHLEVLEAMMVKLCLLADSVRPPPTEAMPEFVYPSRRARQFMEQFPAESGRSSYRLFGELVDRYDDAVRVADA